MRIDTQRSIPGDFVLRITQIHFLSGGGEAQKVIPFFWGEVVQKPRFFEV